MEGIVGLHYVGMRKGRENFLVHKLFRLQQIMLKLSVID